MSERQQVANEANSIEQNHRAHVQSEVGAMLSGLISMLEVLTIQVARIADSAEGANRES